MREIFVLPFFIFFFFFAYLSHEIACVVSLGETMTVILPEHPQRFRPGDTKMRYRDQGTILPRMSS